LGETLDRKEASTVSWAKLCGSFCFHRKVLEADAVTQHRASGAFARMISWSAENLTGGKLSRAVALTIAVDPQVLEALVTVGMLERDGEGYVLHDFGEYNPTGEDLAVRRATLRAKRAEAGRRGAAARWGPRAPAADPPDGAHDASEPAESAGTLGEPDGRLPSAPVARRDKASGPRSGPLLAEPVAADGNGHGKSMRTSPSPSPDPPPSVVSLALLPGDRDPDTVSGRKSKAGALKHSSDEIAAKERVVQTFAACFRAKKQVEPRAILEADHAKAFELVKRFGADEACAIVRRAFEHEFVVRENATLRYIASKADTFRGAAPRKARAQSDQQQALGDEPWLREHLP
jgi:hypothetical protein